MHSITGTDTSGRFAGRTKEKSMNIFLKSELPVLKALAMLGDENFDLQNCFAPIEDFICRLYKSPFKTVTETRWYLYSTKQAQGEALPPTKGALSEHILRAHLVCTVWKSSLNPIQTPLNPLEFGWSTEGNR